MQSVNSASGIELLRESDFTRVRLKSDDGTNRLTRELLIALTSALQELACEKRALVLSGNEDFFSSGADLREVHELTGTSAYEFSNLGQVLMRAIADFPAPVFAAISGYCMGGGLDLALACHRRIASRNAVFGHRGAALGLITGWGGTQRLPRLIGKAPALQMFIAAEKIDAVEALRIGLIDTIADDPIAEAARTVAQSQPASRDFDGS